MKLLYLKGSVVPLIEFYVQRTQSLPSHLFLPAVISVNFNGSFIYIFPSSLYHHSAYYAGKPKSEGDKLGGGWQGEPKPQAECTETPFTGTSFRKYIGFSGSGDEITFCLQMSPFRAQQMWRVKPELDRGCLLALKSQFCNIRSPLQSSFDAFSSLQLEDAEREFCFDKTDVFSVSW